MKVRMTAVIIICLFIVLLPFTKVNSKIADNKQIVKIKSTAISKTEKQRISKILISGLKKISPSVVLLSLSIKPGDFIKDDIIKENIKRIYSTGYFNENITVNVKDNLEGIEITFKVTENPIVQKIIIKGNSLFTEQKILNAIQTKVGNVFNHNVISSDVRSIQNLFDGKGYLMNRVANVQFDGKVMDIIIEENRIGKIKVVGNSKTRDRIILRELRFSEGEIYEANKVEKSLQKIFALGYFSEVRPRCEAGDKPATIDFIIEVIETLTASYTIGGGYSSANGLSGIFEIGQKNWRGKGQTLNARFEFGGTKTYELGFIEPWFKNKRLSFGGNIYNNRATQKFYQPDKSATNYTESRKGFNLSLGKPFSEIVEGSVTFRDENVSLTDADAIQSILNQNYIREGHYQTLSAYIGRDTRDNIFNPCSGTFNAINVDMTGGLMAGPDAFTKYRLTLRKYHALNSRSVIAGRLTGGAIGLTEGTLPLYEEYGVGGVYTIRGYEWREFIGKKMFTGNIEYRYKINKNFESYLFYDFGDAWSSDSLSSTNVASGYNIKKGYGTGFNFVTPIGPIRIDYGKGKSRAGKWYFSMDRMF